MRRIGLLVLVVGLAACGSGASEEDLAAAAEPLVEAHELVEDFSFQIGAGMSRGDFIDRWPPVAAQVARALDDYVDDLPEGLPEADMEDLAAYGVAIANAGDLYTRAVETTRDFIFNDGSESDMNTALNQAEAAVDVLDSVRDRALTPGE